MSAQAKQLIGSLLVAAAIVLVTILIVTAKLGPAPVERDDGGGGGGDRQEQRETTTTTPARGASLLGGQRERELGAPALRVGRPCGAAVGLGHLAHDRQPEPGSRPPARADAAVEPVEHVREVLVGDAGPVVAHHHPVRAGAHQHHARRRAGRRCRAGC